MFLINAGATLLSVIPTSLWFWAFYDLSVKYYTTTATDTTTREHLRRTELLAWLGVCTSNFLALLAWIVVLNEFGAKKKKETT